MGYSPGKVTVKKLLIVLFVLLALAGAGWFVLTSVIIDAEDIGIEMKAALEKASGREVQVSQTRSVSLFPVPEVRFDGLTVSNAQGASSPEFLSATRVTLTLDLMGLLTGDARPSEIRLHDPRLNAEALPGGVPNWAMDGQAGGFGDYLQATPVKLTGGVLSYVNAATGARAELGGIEGQFAFEDDGKILGFSGELDIRGEAAQVKLRMNSVDLSSASAEKVPLQLTLKRAGTTLTAQGQLATMAKQPEFVGQLKADAPNMWNFVSLLSGQPVQAGQENSESPLTVEGSLKVTLRHAVLKNAHVFAKGGGTIPALEGKLDAEYHFGEQARMRIATVTETVDMDYLLEGYRKHFFVDPSLKEQPPLAAEEALSLSEDSPQPTSPLDMMALMEGLSAETDIAIDSLIYNGRSLNQLRLQAQLADGRLLVRDGRASLPGETRLIFSGALHEGQDGLNYDGKFEMQGREMEQFLTLFTPKGVDVPPMDLGRFGMRTNMSFTPKELRFSEFQAIISRTRMAGSIILGREDRPVLRSYLRVADINLDNVGKAVSFMLPKDEGVKKAAAEQGQELFNAEYVNTRFNWLASVGLDMNADFYLQNFVLMGRKGDAAKFHLNLGLGHATLQDMQARYNGADITGTYALHAQIGQNPKLVASGTVSEINMVDFFPQLAQVRNDREWQEYLDKNLALELLQTYRAELKLRIGALAIRSYQFSNLDTEVLLEKNRLSIDRFNGTLWDGKIEARLKMDAGAVPALSSSFAVQNASLVRLSEATRMLKHAGGLTALSGQLSTSGLSLRSWFNNVQGEIRVQGQDISVQGFGITNLARAVPVARTVSDVEKAARLATNGGVTRFNTLRGNINVAEGKASTPRLAFTSTEASGTLDGSVDLVNETVDMGMEFYLLNTLEQGEQPPMLKLTISGDIDNLRKQLETRQLENYVSQKAAKRALGR
jgi:uncharacterized protein involved in outer membrane biogenesis